jgi:hypothetical protein
MLQIVGGWVGGGGNCHSNAWGPQLRWEPQAKIFKILKTDFFDLEVLFFRPETFCYRIGNTTSDQPESSAYLKWFR